MEVIKVGRSSFKAETLRNVTKKEAIDIFKNIDKTIVEKAWHLASPKRQKRPRKNSKN